MLHEWEVHYVVQEEILFELACGPGTPNKTLGIVSERSFSHVGSCNMMTHGANELEITNHTLCNG